MTFSTQDELIDAGITLINRLVSDSRRIFDSLPKGLDGEDENNRLAVCKHLMMNGSLLASQLCSAATRDEVLLATLGVKTLFENELNASFIFRHPRKRDDIERIYSLCKEFFDQGNDDDAIKFKFGGKSIPERCRAIDKPDDYLVYKVLSSYTHMAIKTSRLHSDKWKPYAKAKCFQLATVATLNTNGVVIEQFGVEDSGVAGTEVEDFFLNVNHFLNSLGHDEPVDFR